MTSASARRASTAVERNDIWDTPVSFGEEDAANYCSEQEFYAGFHCAACIAASAASAWAAQREIELDPHRIVEPFGAAPVTLADAELEATDVG